MIMKIEINNNKVCFGLLELPSSMIVVVMNYIYFFFMYFNFFAIKIEYKSNVVKRIKRIKNKKIKKNKYFFLKYLVL